MQSYSENESSCPACATKNEKILDILKSQAKKVEGEDEFQQRMETAEDKFSVVSEYMGLGVFRNKNLLSEDKKDQGHNINNNNNRRQPQSECKSYFSWGDSPQSSRS